MWISVEESTPFPDEDVLAVDEKGRIIISFYYDINRLLRARTKIRKKYYPVEYRWSKRYFNFDRITHWMPLPNPPENIDTQ